MSSIVQELQRDCLESEVEISTLLRKALVIARKLEIEDFERWINLELSGYDQEEEVPDYRKVSGKLNGFNPYHGWQPIYIDDEKISETFESTSIREPITNIEDHVYRSGEQDSKVHIQLAEQAELEIMRMIREEVKIRYIVDPSQFKKIIEEVKNITLNWSLKLEENGILGEDMSFSKKEKEKAEKEKYSSVHFHGNQKNVQIQQDTKDSEQSISITGALNIEEVEKLISSIEDKYDKINLNEKNKQELSNEIEDIKAELSTSNPDKNRIRNSLKTIKDMAKQVAGDLIAAGIVNQISSIL